MFRCTFCTEVIRSPISIAHAANAETELVEMGEGRIGSSDHGPIGVKWKQTINIPHFEFMQRFPHELHIG